MNGILSYQAFENKRPLMLLVVGLAAASFVWSVKLNGLCLILLVAFAFFKFRTQQTFSKVDWLILCLGGMYYILCGIALLYTDNISEGLFHLEKKWTLVLVPPAALIISQNVNGLRPIIFKFFSASIIGASITCLVIAVIKNRSDNVAYGLSEFHINEWYFSYKLLSSNIGIHPAYLAWYVCIAVLYLTHLLFENPYSRKGIALGVTILFLFIFEVLLASRTVLFSTIIVLLIMVFSHVQKTNNYRYYYFAIAIACLTVIVTFSNRILVDRLKAVLEITDTKESQWGTFNIRFEEWSASYELIKRNPVLGVGPGDLMDDLVTVYEYRGLHELAELRYNSHNQFLQTTAGLGGIGLIVLSGIILLSFGAAIQTKDSLYLGFLMTFALFSLTESTLEVQKGITFFVFINSFLFFTSKQTNQKAQKYFSSI